MCTEYNVRGFLFQENEIRDWRTRVRERERESEKVRASEHTLARVSMLCIRAILREAPRQFS